MRKVRAAQPAPVPTRVDLHVKILDDRIVRRAKARGIDVLVYAPHFTRLPAIRERAAAFSDGELLVVPAREIFTGTWRNRKHVLGLGLSEQIPDFISLEGAMDALDRTAGATLAPHPEFLTVSLDESDLRQYENVIDAVEVYNPKHLPRHNAAARRLAGSLDFPAFGSSYAHLPWTVGDVWTRFDRDVETADDLVAAIADGADRVVEYRNGVGHRVRSALEMAHLGFENTWEKVDRLLLSGMEATHPDHIAYDGAFDDVSVY
ncbi:MAG: PHP-associated domain-containing protein [Halanaeroarchaeum sp.]